MVQHGQKQFVFAMKANGGDWSVKYNGISVAGSYDDQVKKAWITTQTQGDRDGWVSWKENPPPVGVEIEVKNEDGDIYTVTPKLETLNWNIDGVWWRRLK